MIDANKYPKAARLREQREEREEERQKKLREQAKAEKVAKGDAPLPTYFNARSRGNKWHLSCKWCGRVWALPKANDHPGNILHLLNHARSHEEAEK